MAGDEVAQLIQIERLHVGDERCRACRGHVGLMVRIADDGSHTVAALDEQWFEQSSDSAVSAEHEDARHEAPFADVVSRYPDATRGGGAATRAVT
ncbi:hypothetical protein GCM10009777_22970 [Microbacterium pumilum]|uniref:Uncharacterized protein n=1 Tax=Microbacterium pumilum TaxID=344165 RepID=A0ABN2SJE6_9MICO